VTTLRVRGGRPLRGVVRVPGDKSISHRALILGALGRGVTRVRGWLEGGDTLATLRVIRALGVDADIERDGTTLAVHGGGLRPPARALDCANSATTMRLMAGILAGQAFASELDGSVQLRRRPMRRITEPLRAMGADIADADGRAPLRIRPAALHGICYEMHLASAQVKSAVLLAGLWAEGETVVIQPGPARDHTERMLRAMGADLAIQDDVIRLRPGAALGALDLDVPGDFSSAAFLLMAALVTPGSDVQVQGVGLNPTRTGLLGVLGRTGADVVVESGSATGGEPSGAVRVRAGGLSGTAVAGAEVVRMIDEIPVWAVAATQAAGRTEVHDAAELRVKEVDRIAALAGELRKLGAPVEERPDGFVVEGPCRLRGAVVDGHGDHRLAMSLVVAGLIAEGETVVRGAECIADSFPGFVERLVALGADIM
jgi:3-phosphoshikimate 1-carboxyvinyltransferase